MKAFLLSAMLLGWGLLLQLASAQSGPTAFPLAGDWDGVLVYQGAVHLSLSFSRPSKER